MSEPLQSAPVESKPSQSALVYDVGGSHVSAAVCHLPGYTLAGIVRAPLPSADSGSGHFSAASFGRLIHALGESSASAAGVPVVQLAGACCAFPGPFDYEHGVSHMQHKLQPLYGIDLKAALAQRFHWSPERVRFLNDAAAYTLGEAGAGAAQGFQRIIGITLGTGIGAAFALRTASGVQIADSRPGNHEGVPMGGELWNLPYNAPPDGSHPAAGATVEDFVSTRFLRHQYLAHTGREEEVFAIADNALKPAPSGKACPETPPPPPVHPDPKDHYAAHCRARQAFQDFGRHLAMALNQHAAAFRPDVIVLGGGVARAASLFLPATRKALAFPATIAISALMDEAPLAGAGVHFFSNPA